MRKVLVYSVGIATLLGLAALAYHVASPKVMLVNRSSAEFEELVVALPSSRVSIGPIHQHSAETIYFSRQASGGTATYSLRDGRGSVVEGSLHYPASGQLFRVISVTIETDGSVSAAVSG